MTHAINIQNLGFAYNGESVLQNVSLTVKQGDFLAVVGPNGGGKTTLLKLLLGLLQPTAGSIDILGGSPGQTPHRIAYVPQHTSLRPGFPVTVEEAVLMGMNRKTRSRFGHRREDRERAVAALDRVGLAGRENFRFDELSGGQMQRALIARALASEAELLLLDEPTANVDPQGSFCLYDFLCNLGDEQDLTIVTVSHDLSILGSRIDSIACVNKQLLYNPTPELSDEMLKMLYGTHEHTCAMDEFLQTVSSQFGEGTSHHHHADHDHNHDHATQSDSENSTDTENTMDQVNGNSTGAGGTTGREGGNSI